MALHTSADPSQAGHVLHTRGFGTTPAAQLPRETIRLSASGFVPDRALPPLDPSDRLKYLVRLAQEAYVEYMNARRRAFETLGLVVPESASAVPHDAGKLDAAS
ncbi:hypothetical protein R3P38DRAFT_3168143 [Favolaschia claudopus]|uniref:Uncharacterized protein n=1 Tax=Favolaschia claudopus TaxID=2862362 RepID=A0AAW0E352_9AGAR